MIVVISFAERTISRMGYIENTSRKYDSSKPLNTCHYLDIENGPEVRGYLSDTPSTCTHQMTFSRQGSWDFVTVTVFTMNLGRLAGNERHKSVSAFFDSRNPGQWYE
jgi:hypothetical protein